MDPLWLDILLKNILDCTRKRARAELSHHEGGVHLRPCLITLDRQLFNLSMQQCLCRLCHLCRIRRPRRVLCLRLLRRLRCLCRIRRIRCLCRQCQLIKSPVRSFWLRCAGSNSASWKKENIYPVMAGALPDLCMLDAPASGSPPIEPMAPCRGYYRYVMPPLILGFRWGQGSSFGVLRQGQSSPKGRYPHPDLGIP